MDNKLCLITLDVPDEVAIVAQTLTYHRLISKKTFTAGDIVFQNTSQYVPAGTTVIATFAVHPTGDVVTKTLSEVDHSINRENIWREYFGFDCFSDHSCDPNTETKWLTKTDYIVIALRDIQIGDPITCDYTSFINATSDDAEFVCACNSPKCKGIIKI